MTFARAGMAALAAVLAHASVSQARAQAERLPPNFHCGKMERGLGRIEGRLIPDSSSRGSLAQPIYINAEACATIADSLGRFAISGIVPGSYTLSAGESGKRRTSPLPVRVVGDSVTTVEIPLRARNVVSDCNVSGACATELDPPADDALRGLTDPERLLEAVFRATVYAARAESPYVFRSAAYCLAVTAQQADMPPPPAVLAVVSARIPLARQRGECRGAGQGLNVLYYLGQTESRATVIRVGTLSISGDEARSVSSYHFAWLWAGGWECRFIRAGAGWKPVTCVMGWSL